MSIKDYAQRIEISSLAVLFLSFFVILKIAFYKESFYVTFMLCFSLFWNYALPGFCLFLFYREKLVFFERFVFGTILGFAVVSISSYYLGLAGIHARYHHFFIPPLFIAFGLLLGYLAEKKKI